MEVVLPLPGAFFLTQVAACQAGGQEWAVCCLAVSGPFLDNNLRSLLLHWAAARAGGKWEQPPQGWVSSPTECHAQGGWW